MSVAWVVLNEQHTLLPQQEALLNENYAYWKVFVVPATGWTLLEMMDIEDELLEEARHLLNSSGDEMSVVFASPVPALLKYLSGRDDIFTYVLHNDNREKKELPGGKIITTVAKEGWVLA